MGKRFPDRMGPQPATVGGLIKYSANILLYADI